LLPCHTDTVVVLSCDAVGAGARPPCLREQASKKQGSAETVLGRVRRFDGDGRAGPRLPTPRSPNRGAARALPAWGPLGPCLSWLARNCIRARPHRMCLLRAPTAGRACRPAQVAHRSRPGRIFQPCRVAASCLSAVASHLVGSPVKRLQQQPLSARTIVLALRSARRYWHNQHVGSIIGAHRTPRPWHRDCAAHDGMHGGSLRGRPCVFESTKAPCLRLPGSC